jgi:hypothetical protein
MKPERPEATLVDRLTLHKDTIKVLTSPNHSNGEKGAMPTGGCCNSGGSCKT